MIDNEKPVKKEYINDLGSELMKAENDIKKLGENPTSEEEAAYILGVTVEEYQKKILEQAEARGLTVEEYQKQTAEYTKKLAEKEQEFIKTGNPVSVILDDNGEIVNEVHRIK